MKVSKNRSRRVKEKHKRTIHYTSGDWSVRTYERNIVTTICHTHSSSDLFIIPFGYSRDSSGRCHRCGAQAPLGVRTVWTFFNWSRFGE